MTERPTFSQIFLDLAQALSKRSTCKRIQVGAVITSVDHRRVFAIGYNGGASGHQNDCDSDDPTSCGCLHAEENAVINCNVSREEPKYVYTTETPCLMCAKRLINLGGVERVMYRRETDKPEGLALLEKSRIVVVHDFHARG